MSQEQHLKHWRSQIVELQDRLLTHEITVDQFHAAAYPIQKKIREAEAK